MAVDMLRHLILSDGYSQPLSRNARRSKGHAKRCREATGQAVKVPWAGQGCTGSGAKNAAQAAGVELWIVKLPDAIQDFVLLLWRWVVEHSFC